jgi:formylmethanofuran:tetrahydromethanopterin formyltransferase
VDKASVGAIVLFIIVMLFMGDYFAFMITRPPSALANMTPATSAIDQLAQTVTDPFGQLLYAAGSAFGASSMPLLSWLSNKYVAAALVALSVIVVAFESANKGE